MVIVEPVPPMLLLPLFSESMQAVNEQTVKIDRIVAKTFIFI